MKEERNSFGQQRQLLVFVTWREYAKVRTSRTISAWQCITEDQGSRMALLIPRRSADVNFALFCPTTDDNGAPVYAASASHFATVHEASLPRGLMHQSLYATIVTRSVPYTTQMKDGRTLTVIGRSKTMGGRHNLQQAMLHCLPKCRVGLCDIAGPPGGLSR